MPLVVGKIRYSRYATSGRENPIFKNFDTVLDIARDNGVVLSLALSLRAGCIHDQLDTCYLSEIKTTRTLVKKALGRRLPVMVEGIGHTSIGNLPRLIGLIKHACYNIPLRTLGPLVCDIAAGMDDVCGAIGAAIAAHSGANLLGVVTRSEHIGMPSRQDVVDAIRAFAVAAHAADVERPKELERNVAVSIARRDRMWRELWRMLLFGDLARSLRQRTVAVEDDTCTMCGQMCALKLISNIWKDQRRWSR